MEEEKGWVERLASHVGDRLSAITSEVGQYATDKFIPQGAAGLAKTALRRLPLHPGWESSQRVTCSGFRSLASSVPYTSQKSRRNAW